MELIDDLVVTRLSTTPIKGMRLERESGLGAIDPRRFRLLIQFTSETGHIEDTWEGLEVEVGTARLRVGASVPRCAAVTRDPEGGKRDSRSSRPSRPIAASRPPGSGGAYRSVSTPTSSRTASCVTATP
jgi:uncharacterized protein YcbX